MTRRILIVDDDRQMVRTLSDIVRMHGWEPSGAYSGEAAVEEVRKESYSAVLMDVKMAGINGVTAFREMKRFRPNIRVVLMTAYATIETAVDLRSNWCRLTSVRHQSDEETITHVHRSASCGIAETAPCAGRRN